MTTTLQDLKPSQIKPHKANPRRDVGDVDELAASIREQGILEPLIVAPAGEGPISGQLYTLIAGHRRLAAAKVAKAKTVPCLIREDLAQDVRAQLELMLVENLQRADLSPVEEGEAYQQLLTFPGYTQTRIAKATGRAIATVRSRLKLAGLPKSALERVHAGQISLGEAEALVEFAGDKAAYARLERSAGNPAKFGRNLQDLRNGTKATRAKERIEKQLAEAGVRVIPAPSLYKAGPTRLYGDDIGPHRDCPGFAAFIQFNSYSGTADGVYVCDKPELHRSAEAPPRADDEASAAERKAVDERLAADAGVRRTWIRDHVFREPSEGLALDMLRSHAAQLVQEYGASSDLMDFVLGIPLEVDHEVDLEPARLAAIADLGLLQLAVLLDLIDHDQQEEALLRPYGWGNSYGTSEWRERLSTLYGYRWSEHEQQLVDAAAAAADGDDD